MYVRRHRLLAECIQLLSVNTKVSCFCGLKSAKVAKRLGRSPRPLWVSFAYSLAEMIEARHIPLRSCGCLPTLAANPRHAPLFVGGGGGGGGGGAIIVLCPRALNNHTTPLTRVNALILQSSFGVTYFVSEVVFLKMPSRTKTNERNDVLNTFKFETMF